MSGYTVHGFVFVPSPIFGTRSARVSVTLHEDCVVTFHDHDLRVDGEFGPVFDLNEARDAALLFVVARRMARRDFISTDLSRRDALPGNANGIWLDPITGEAA